MSGACARWNLVKAGERGKSYRNGVVMARLQCLENSEK
jgi:hypothetical protein